MLFIWWVKILFVKLYFITNLKYNFYEKDFTFRSIFKCIIYHIKNPTFALLRV